MRRTTQTRDGFTLMEVMMSVLIIAMLLSLLIVGMLHARRYVQGVTDKQAVDAVFVGVTEFEQRFGFPPPLVRERSPTQPAAVEDRPASASDAGIGVRRRYAVYNPFGSNAATAAAQESLLRHEGRPAPPAGNPFEDYRYSDRTLPFYLVGPLNEPYASGATGIPIDGVPGPGFYTPEKDGSYGVPRDVIAASINPSARMRAGQKFDALVAFSGSAPRLFTDPTPPANPDDRGIELRDRTGVAMRYYRWLPFVPATPRTQTIDQLRDLRIPPLVGRLAVDPTRNPSSISTPADRDLEKNTALKTAAWAIVAAGPDGAFGDEPLAELAQRLGVAAIAPADELKIRQQAEKDNLVRVGD